MEEREIREVWDGRPECRDCGIRHIALFADLQEPDFFLIHRPIEHVEISPGDPLYTIGAPANHIYTLKAGRMKMVQYLADGTARIVRLPGPGSTLGLETLSSETYEHSAVALEPSWLCRIPRDVITRLAEQTPRIHKQLLDRWYAASKDADRWLTELNSGTSRVRVSRLILELTNRETGQCILLSREDMGAILGLTTETVSRIVAELRRTGLIEKVAPHTFRPDLAGLSAVER